MRLPGFRGLRRQGVPRLLAALAIAVLALVGFPRTALAHTYLDHSDPPDGASLVVAPSTVSLTYSEDIELRLTSVVVADGAGRHIAVTTSTDLHRPTTLVVHLPRVAHGLYQVTWSVRDSEDLHLTSGSVVFGVGTTPTGALSHPATTAPGAMEVALKVVSRGGLTLLLGALAIGLGVVPGAIRDKTRRAALRRRLLGLAAMGLSVAIVADSILLGVQAQRAGTTWASLGRLLTHDTVGRSWLVETAVGLPLTVALLVLRAGGPGHRRRWRAGPLVVGLGAVVVAAAVALAGHTGTAPRPTAWATGLRASHLLAVGVWLGGLACVTLSLVWLRARPAPVGTAGETRAILESYSALAAASMAAIVVTGLALSGREVATVTALLSTWYGAILLTKVSVLALVAVLGLRHARAVRTSAAGGPTVSLRSLRLELAGGAMVLALGAALSATGPALGPQFAQATAVAPSMVTQQTADLIVRTTVTPNRPGLNLVSALVLNTRRPVPGAIDAVTIDITRPGTTALHLAGRPQADGTWSAGQVQLTKGPMTVEVSVRRAGLASRHANMAWTVNDYARWVHPRVLSLASWGPMADALAWGGVALAAAIFVLRRLRRIRAAAPDRPIHRFAIGNSPLGPGDALPGRSSR